ncbi:MAG: bifunctional isocitrate dehydrogenase kinase/phosphatase [Saprospiraceae bacterium]|nr:bifunctional isocitrate dehydrogenase kinase/phosphatase [Saprospiraceae bacterium]
MPHMFEKLLPYEASHLILGAYFNYWHAFRGITKRAQIRFENRDWTGIQSDARERISLYRDAVGRTTEQVLLLMGDRRNDDRVWKSIKEYFTYEVKNFNTRNIAETFYNSVYRHSHKGLSADENNMFVHATATYREFKSTDPIYHSFSIDQDLQYSFRSILRRYKIDLPWENLDRDLGFLEKTFQEVIDTRSLFIEQCRIETIKSIFFRNKGAYIVGRLWSGREVIPFVIPMLNGQDGLFIDALLSEDRDVSSLFSYNRSYFLVDVDIASEMVDFLRSFLPTKSLGELYNSIGFEKHGKTVFYRDFLRHLEKSKDQFIEAPGIKGMVMHVFMLPSYNVVFKIIKDHFAPPKQVTEEEVKYRYELVNLHDRAGRMTDTHMFENLVFDRNRFSEELLTKLLKDAGSKVTLGEETVEIKHLYVEKKMTPLNIYLETASEEDAEDVIDGYGYAIKEMAAVNIFPGDMLLKNFGVTRLKRVVFYDYDEIGFLTDFNFRVIPEARDEFEEMSATPYFHVGHNDIFPEEFPRFLIGNPKLREMFHRLHGDLYHVKFWRDMQERLRRQEIVEVYPYRYRQRFCEKFAGYKETDP